MMKKASVILVFAAVISMTSCSTISNLAGKLGIPEGFRTRAEQEAIRSSHRAGVGSGSAVYGGTSRTAENNRSYESFPQKDLPVLTDTSRTVAAPVVVPPAQEIKDAEEEVWDGTLTDQQRRLIRAAKAKIGCRYQYAAKGPNAFDCSGFMMYVFAKEGIKLVPGSMAQYTMGRALKKNEHLKPCDLVFFSGRKISGNVGHVGMVVDYDEATGDFTFIHASCSCGIEIQHSTADYYARRYIGARRILDDDGTAIESDPDVVDTDVVIPMEPEKPVEQWYTIKSGDTLSKIALKYHTSVSSICRLNGIKETTVLQIGRKLKIK